MRNTLCPYCGRDESADPLNNEHVLPRALGGNLEPTNPFLIRAHTKCNRTCGKWVDAPFVRSYFLHNARALASRHCVDPSCDPILPSFYMGAANNWVDDDLVCDLWIGPTGDHVYHFHRPYPTAPTIVGRPGWIDAAELDPGVVFVAIVASNPAWHPIIVNSVKDTFPGASLHLLNAAPAGQTPPHPPVRAEHQRLLDWVAALPADGTRWPRTSIDMTCGDRFLVKVALGLGAALLGDEYIASEDAQLLRTALWTQDIAKWPTGIRGIRFFSKQDPQFVDLIGWNGCHTVLVGVSADAVGVTLNLYGKYSASMVMSRTPARWIDRLDPNGMLWIVAPGLRAFAGPMTLMQYAGERTAPAPTGPLVALQARIDAAMKLPPVHLATA